MALLRCFVLLLAASSCYGSSAVVDLGSDADLENDISIALGMMNTGDSFSMDHEDHMTALLETEVLDRSHASEALETHAQIEAAVGHAIHATMVEHDMHTSEAKVKGFFADLFNCHKCKLNSGNAGMTLKKLFGADTAKLDKEREAKLLAGFGKKDLSKDDFVKKLEALKKTALEDNQKFADKKIKEKNPLINNIHTYRWWSDVTSADLGGIFDSITVDEMLYRQELVAECEDLNTVDDVVHDATKKGTAATKADECDKKKHCLSLLTTSVLTGQDKLICSAKMEVVEELREAKAKKAKAAAKGKAPNVKPDKAAQIMIQELKHGEADLAEKAADMEIEAANALEWQVAGPAGFDPVPNLMRSYVCSPLDPTKFQLTDKVLGDRRNKKQATTVGNDVKATEADAAAEAAKQTDGKGSGHAPAEVSMLTKVVQKVKEFIGKAFVKIKAALQTLWRMMYTAMRCGVCVICNLIEELVQFFKKMGERMKVLLKAMSEGIKQCGKMLADTGKSIYANIKGSLFGQGVVKDGQPKLDEGKICALDKDCKDGHYCGTRENLIQRKCQKNNNIKENKCCYDKERDCEKPLICVNVGMGIVGCKNKCMKNDPKKKKMRRLLALTALDQNRRLGAAKARKLRAKMHRLQKMHAVMSRLLAQHESALGRENIEASLMSKHAAKLMIAKTVSMMHAHTDSGHVAQMRRATTSTASSFTSIPNACISEQNLGSGMGIAVNVENPNLVKMLAKVAKNFAGMMSLPLPDILIGITPTTFANAVADPACLANVAARTANNNKGVAVQTLADGVDAQVKAEQEAAQQA